ncbi:MAG: hypothetical protein NDJ18_03275 [candidate division Zixibacteria bacterium]|nr:hypothetical protein [candidate division Zixibacteria bacterium]
MKSVQTILMVSFLGCAIMAQDSTLTEKPLAPEQIGMAHLMEYLNLTTDDITYRSDYTEPDSFRLKIVADLMRRPLDMINYTKEIRTRYSAGQPEILAGMLFQDLQGEYQTKRGNAYPPSADDLQAHYDLYYSNLYMNQVLSRAANYINVIIPRSTESALAGLTAKQRAFLRNEFKELLVTHEEEEFLSVEGLDSLEKVEEKYTDTLVTFGARINTDPILAAGISFLREFMPELMTVKAMADSGGQTRERLLNNVGYIPNNVSTEKYLGKQSGWKIGGPGRDIYSGDYTFILDLGGDDIYELSYDPAKPHPVIIIDLGGNDSYTGITDFAIASGCYSVGILLDFAGDDLYRGKSFSVGSGYFGMGLLYDANGDDRYDGDTHVQGAGSYGMGIVIDESGRDIYNAALFAQGFGFIKGAGIIYDGDGADSYYAGGKYKDILRYDEHYLSMSQGFGYGLRPWTSGGLGYLIDLKGNDSYYSDIFAQGASYWWSLGMLYDSAGNDNYQSYQYAQGAATHMTLGILVDEFGHDVYFGKGLMQGVGHDYSCAIMLDRHGNDTYTAYDLSQGAGSANGAGIQIDNEGDDRYFIKNPNNTHGFGDTRRDFGSIGLFIDLSGLDQYTGFGKDNFYWKTESRWGGGMDIELHPKDSVQANKP